MYLSRLGNTKHSLTWCLRVAWWVYFMLCCDAGYAVFSLLNGINNIQMHISKYTRNSICLYSKVNTEAGKRVTVQIHFSTCSNIVIASLFIHSSHLDCLHLSMRPGEVVTFSSVQASQHLH